MKTITVLLCLVLTGLSFPRADALADCLNGMRKATIEEKNFAFETLTALKHLLPTPPEGWNRHDNTEIRDVNAESYVCNREEDEPVYHSFSTEYAWEDGHRMLADLQQRHELDRKALDLPPEKKEEADELGRQGDRIFRIDVKKAIAAGNKDEAARLEKEAEALIRKGDAIRAAHDKTTFSKRMELMDKHSKEHKAIQKRLFVKVRAVVNGYSVSLANNVSKPSYEGVPLALRDSKTTYIFFGDWKLDGKPGDYAKVKALMKEMAQATSVQSFHIELTGEPEQVDRIASGLNTETAKSMLAK